MVETLAEMSGEPADRVREVLGISGLSVSPKKKRTKGELKLPVGLVHLQTCHRRYLTKRKFDADVLEKVWGLMGIGLAHRLAWRLFIPIHYQGKVVSWTTRRIDDTPGGLRYITAKSTEEEMPCKSLLYGSDHVRHAAVVVEGPADAWRIGPGAVALLGTGWSKAQMAKLAKVPVRTIIFDNEPEAQRRARRLADSLGVFPGRTRVAEINAADPGSAGEKEVALIRKSFLGD